MAEVDTQRSRRFTNGLIAAFAVVGIAAAVVFYLRDSGKAAELDAVSASSEAACSYALVLADFDYSDGLDTFLDAVSAGATGEYATEFAAARNDIKTAMTSAEVKSRGEGVRCGWISGSIDTATVLVAVTQFRTSVGQPVEQRSDLTVEMSLDRAPSGKWLVNRMDSPLLKGGVGVFGGGEPAPTPSPEQAATPAPEPTPGN
ncbi:hypothetical protein [Nocardia lasii]|uniref:Mce-associated membrane protein n=1 Tax=Nocardia lasii TaxID=1616107 RepID=A0ABW1JRJ6_9NOCA